MSTDAEKLDECKALIEQQLAWGSSTAWQQQDFQRLRERIFDRTGVDLSESTLRRIWGKVKYDHLPSSTTLNTLAQFAGFESWRAFVNLKQTRETSVSDQARQITKRPVQIKWTALIAGVSAMAIIVFIVLFGFKKSRKVVVDDYSFTSRPITRSIPNSVVFEYNASAAGNDSVFILQSWDQQRKTLVNRHDRYHTSVYYEPGFYQAKLVVGNTIVKEHPLIIPTNGWLAMINRTPVPVYLNSGELTDGDLLRVKPSALTQHNIQLQPDPPVTKFYNVGNFTPVAASTFSFEAEIKNEYSEGAGACQLSEIALITDGMPITIPLADSGCISELSLIVPGKMVSGKKEDLSGFGVDFSSWVKVECRSSGKTIEYFINGKRAYVCDLSADAVNIVGLGIFFKGTGAIRKVALRDNSKIVFER